MPHQCTECGHVFPDGSKEMLSGCPECGGNKFQFHPGGVPDDASAGESDGTTEPPERSRVTGAVGRAADTVRGIVRDDADREPPERPPEDADVGASDLPEDRAQASARSEVVDENDLPDSREGRAEGGSAGEKPDIEELREELNDQFESIRILDRGHYELNLMELYDREEYIIALQENGRYVIEVPESWHGED